MPSKSLISKSPYILAPKLWDQHDPATASMFCSHRMAFFRDKFWRAAVRALLSQPSSQQAAMPSIHLLQGILPSEESTSLAQQTLRAHTPPAASPFLPRNVNPLSLAHWSHTFGITSKYTFKWTVKSHCHLGRTAHLKIYKQGTKGLKTCLQSNMHSAGLSFLKYLTRQSSQTKQAFLVLLLLLWHLSKKIALNNFLYFFLITLRMQTAVFQFAMRNLPQKRGQPRVQSPVRFTAPPTLLLLLVQSLGTGIMLRFISKTAAPAQCGAKSTEDTENLCTDLSDLQIKCTEISALCARGIQLSSENKRKATDLHFFGPFSFFFF